MKQAVNHTGSLVVKVTNKQLLEFYIKDAKLEQKKAESLKNIMSEDLKRVTSGKSIIVSNNKPR